MSEELEKVYGLSDESEGSPAGTCDPLCSVDEMSSEDFETNYKPHSDIVKAVSVGALALAITAIVQHSWVAENQASWLYSPWKQQQQQECGFYVAVGFRILGF